MVDKLDVVTVRQPDGAPEKLPDADTQVVIVPLKTTSGSLTVMTTDSDATVPPASRTVTVVV